MLQYLVQVDAGGRFVHSGDIRQAKFMEVQKATLDEQQKLIKEVGKRDVQCILTSDHTAVDD